MKAGERRNKKEERKGEETYIERKANKKERRRK